MFALFLSHGGESERHLVLAQQAIAAVQIQLVLRLLDDDVIGRRDLIGDAGDGTRGADHEPHKYPQHAPRKNAAAIGHRGNYSVDGARYNALQLTGPEYNFKMFLPRFAAIVAAGLMAGCAAQSSTKPAEVLDERTGMTVGALHKPIELIQSAQDTAISGRHISFAYLGPVEWDNMGNLSYGLWVHLAPGNDWRFDNIRMPGAVTLTLDDGATVLSAIEPPALGQAPYRRVASWGQTAYFDLDVQMLKRMAASREIALDFKADRESPVRFTADRDARKALMSYLHARGY